MKTQEKMFRVNDPAAAQIVYVGANPIVYAGSPSVNYGTIPLGGKRITSIGIITDCPADLIPDTLVLRIRREAPLQEVISEIQFPAFNVMMAIDLPLFIQGQAYSYSLTAANLFIRGQAPAAGNYSMWIHEIAEVA